MLIPLLMIMKSIHVRDVIPIYYFIILIMTPNFLESIFYRITSFILAIGSRIVAPLSHKSTSCGIAVFIVCQENIIAFPFFGDKFIDS